MQYILTPPKKLNATITLPASKSISNRALIIHAVSGGKYLPDNLSDCDDTQVMINALHNMPKTMDMRAAGTSMRFMTAYLSIIEGEHILTGTQRMKERPIGVLVDALRYLGADITYLENEGFPPLKIKGKNIIGGRVEMRADVSSQYVSAILMIAPALKNGLELHLIGEIASRPYIDMTLSIMREYGANVEWTSVDTITVAAKTYNKDVKYYIENDWSAASYWYEMMAIAGDIDSCIKLEGLMDASQQGDSVVRHIFSLLGVKTIYDIKDSNTLTTITLKRIGAQMPRLDYDFGNSPDLAQTLVVCCCIINRPFHFTGLASLKFKESNRLKALEKELRKVGYVIKELNGSELMWNGEKCTPSDEPLDTYDDHRMAMAFAPISLISPELRINDPLVVSKSYTKFWEHLKLAGFNIKEALESK